MTVEHSRPAVGTSATVVARAIGTTEEVSVDNATAQTVYLGGAGVTTSSYGIALAPGDTFTTDLHPGDALYAVAAVTSTVGVLHIGQGA